MASSIHAIRHARSRVARTQAKASRVAAIDDLNESNPKATPQPNPTIGELADTTPLPAARIDKSTLALGEPRRYRNKAHLRFVV